MACKYKVGGGEREGQEGGLEAGSRLYNESKRERERERVLGERQTTLS